MVIVAHPSPLLGGIADRGGVGKPFFVGFTMVSVTATALLATLQPGMVVPGFLLAVIGLVCFEAAFVYYNSYLPRIAAPAEIGRVSAAGFAVGYAGSIVAFGLAYPFVAAQVYWATFLAAAAQFALCSLPAFLTLPADTRHAVPLGTAVARGLGETLTTLREILRHPDRTQMRRFLPPPSLFQGGGETIIRVPPAFFPSTPRVFPHPTIVPFLVLP